MSLTRYGSAFSLNKDNGQPGLTTLNLSLIQDKHNHIYNSTPNLAHVSPAHNRYASTDSNDSSNYSSMSSSNHSRQGSDSQEVIHLTRRMSSQPHSIHPEGISPLQFIKNKGALELAHTATIQMTVAAENKKEAVLTRINDDDTVGGDNDDWQNELKSWKNRRKNLSKQANKSVEDTTQSTKVEEVDVSQRTKLFSRTEEERERLGLSRMRFYPIQDEEDKGMAQNIVTDQMPILSGNNNAPHDQYSLEINSVVASNQDSKYKNILTNTKEKNVHVTTSYNLQNSDKHVPEDTINKIHGNVSENSTNESIVSSREEKALRDDSVFRSDVQIEHRLLPDAGSRAENNESLVSDSENILKYFQTSTATIDLHNQSFSENVYKNSRNTEIGNCSEKYVQNEIVLNNSGRNLSQDGQRQNNNSQSIRISAFTTNSKQQQASGIIPKEVLTCDINYLEKANAQATDQKMALEVETRPTLRVKRELMDSMNDLSFKENNHSGYSQHFDTSYEDTKQQDQRTRFNFSNQEQKETKFVTEKLWKPEKDQNEIITTNMQLPSKGPSPGVQGTPLPVYYTTDGTLYETHSEHDNSQSLITYATNRTFCGTPSEHDFRNSQSLMTYTTDRTLYGTPSEHDLHNPQSYMTYTTDRTLCGTPSEHDLHNSPSHMTSTTDMIFHLTTLERGANKPPSVSSITPFHEVATVQERPASVSGGSVTMFDSRSQNTYRETASSLELPINLSTHPLNDGVTNIEDINHVELRRKESQRAEEYSKARSSEILELRLKEEDELQREKEMIRLEREKLLKEKEEFFKFVQWQSQQQLLQHQQQLGVPDPKLNKKEQHQIPNYQQQQDEVYQDKEHGVPCNNKQQELGSYFKQQEDVSYQKQQEIPYKQQGEVSYQKQQGEVSYQKQQKVSFYKQHSVVSYQEQPEVPYHKQQEEMAYQKQLQEVPYHKQQEEMSYQKQLQEVPYHKQQEEMAYQKQQQEVPYHKQQDELQDPKQYRQAPFLELNKISNYEQQQDMLHLIQQQRLQEVEQPYLKYQQAVSSHKQQGYSPYTYMQQIPYYKQPEEVLYKVQPATVPYQEQQYEVPYQKQQHEVPNQKQQHEVLNQEQQHEVQYNKQEVSDYKEQHLEVPDDKQHEKVLYKQQQQTFYYKQQKDDQYNKQQQPVPYKEQQQEVSYHQQTVMYDKQLQTETCNKQLQAVPFQQEQPRIFQKQQEHVPNTQMQQILHHNQQQAPHYEQQLHITTLTPSQKLYQSTLPQQLPEQVSHQSLQEVPHQQLQQASHQQIQQISFQNLYHQIPQHQQLPLQSHQQLTYQKQVLQQQPLQQQQLPPQEYLPQQQSLLQSQQLYHQITLHKPHQTELIQQQPFSIQQPIPSKQPQSSYQPLPFQQPLPVQQQLKPQHALVSQIYQIEPFQKPLPPDQFLLPHQTELPQQPLPPHQIFPPQQPYQTELPQQPLPPHQILSPQQPHQRELLQQLLPPLHILPPQQPDQTELLQQPLPHHQIFPSQQLLQTELPQQPLPPHQILLPQQPHQTELPQQPLPPHQILSPQQSHQTELPQQPLPHHQIFPSQQPHQTELPQQPLPPHQILLPQQPHQTELPQQPLPPHQILSPQQSHQTELPQQPLPHHQIFPSQQPHQTELPQQPLPPHQILPPQQPHQIKLPQQSLPLHQILPPQQPHQIVPQQSHQIEPPQQPLPPIQPHHPQQHPQAQQTISHSSWQKGHVAQKTNFFELSKKKFSPVTFRPTKYSQQTSSTTANTSSPTLEYIRSLNATPTTEIHPTTEIQSHNEPKSFQQQEINGIERFGFQKPSRSCSENNLNFISGDLKIATNFDNSVDLIDYRQSCSNDEMSGKETAKTVSTISESVAAKTSNTSASVFPESAAYKAAGISAATFSERDTTKGVARMSQNFSERESIKGAAKISQNFSERAAAKGIVKPYLIQSQSGVDNRTAKQFSTFIGSTDNKIMAKPVPKFSKNITAAVETGQLPKASKSAGVNQFLRHSINTSDKTDKFVSKEVSTGRNFHSPNSSSTVVKEFKARNVAPLVKLRDDTNWQKSKNINSPIRHPQGSLSQTSHKASWYGDAKEEDSVFNFEDSGVNFRTKEMERRNSYQSESKHQSFKLSNQGHVPSDLRKSVGDLSNRQNNRWYVYDPSNSEDEKDQSVPVPVLLRQTLLQKTAGKQERPKSVSHISLYSEENYHNTNTFYPNSPLSPQSPKGHYQQKHKQRPASESYNRLEGLFPPHNPGLSLQGQDALPVNGDPVCCHCSLDLGSGAAMKIESLDLCFHLECFKCFNCQTSLGAGTQNADVRVKDNKLLCINCYHNS